MRHEHTLGEMSGLSARPVKLKYDWRKGRERWDMVHMGEPDCFAYIIRHWSEIWKGAAWCWILYMPRAGRETARGWASAPHTAKRQVEATIEELWR